MKELDPVIHQPVRLRIMAALCALDDGDAIDFTRLKHLLDVTDGNLGAHIVKLEAARYIKVDKHFAGRKPRTHLSATGRGRDAFDEHRIALREILES